MPAQNRLLIAVTVISGVSALAQAPAGTSDGISLGSVKVAFAYPFGYSPQAVGVSGVVNYSAAASTTDGSPWLLLSDRIHNSGSFASIPSTKPVILLLSSFATTLAAGNYTGSVVVSDVSNSANKATITVTLAVNGSGTTSLIVSPSTELDFWAQTAGLQPVPNQSLWLSAPAGTFTAAVTSNTPWLTLGASSGQIPGSLQVFVSNLGGLAANTYTGNIRLIAGSLTQDVKVVLTLSDAPVALAGFASGGTSSGTSSGTVLITSSGGMPQQVAVFASDGPGDVLALSEISAPIWLAVTQGVTSNGQQAVTITANGEGAVLYSADVTLNATNGNNGANTIANNPVFIPVVVATGGSAGPLTITPNQLTFQSSTSGVTPASIGILVGTSAVTPYYVSTPTPWINVSTGYFYGNQRMTVTVTPGTLAANKIPYSGEIDFATNGVTERLPVSLTVTGDSNAGNIGADKTNLGFTYVAGGSAPAAQPVLISGSTGGFTAIAASDTGNWLMVTPSSGAVGTNITVSVDPTGIAIGSYTGTVTIAGTNGLTGQAVINVSLTVTAPLPSATSVINGASGAQGTVAPGEVITLIGTHLGPATAATAQVVNGFLTTQLGGVQVLVSGVPAPMIYASATQVSAVVPYEVARFSVAAVEVKYLGQTSNIVSLPVVATAPGIFTLNQSGAGPVVGFNSDFSLNGPNNPAQKGSTIFFFLTGEGQTNPAGVTGTINTTPNQNPKPIAGITVTVGGQPATYSYAGGIEGVVEGIMQLNIQVPANAPSGAVPLVVTIGGNSTQSGVTVSVQ